MPLSNNLKVICGWNNKLFIVIDHKVIKSEIDNRGSKSGLLINPVKEQRVYDSSSIIGR